ncbi:MAG: tautomerase family protein [Magnetospiraceae bacterium]
MPIIEMHLMEGRTVEQKRKMAEAVTQAVVESLGVSPQTVRILITQHDAEGFFVAGQNMEQRAKEKSASKP